MSEPDNLLTPHHPAPPPIGEKQERSELLARVAGEKEFIRPVEKQYGLLFARYGVPGIAEFGNRHTLCDERIRQHPGIRVARTRSEEHTSELQSLMRISYAVFCLKKKKSHIKSKTDYATSTTTTT